MPGNNKGKGKKPASSSSRAPQSNAAAGSVARDPYSGRRLQLPSIEGQNVLPNIPGRPTRTPEYARDRAPRPTVNPAPRFHPNDPTGAGRIYPARPLPAGPALIDSLPGRTRPQQPPASPAPASRQSPRPAQQASAAPRRSSDHQRRSTAPSPPQRLPAGQWAGSADNRPPHGSSAGGRPAPSGSDGNPNRPRY